MSAIDDFTDAFDALIDEIGVTDSLSVVTGAFVGLALAVIKSAGHSTDGDILIDGGESRNITIHNEKVKP